MPPLLFSCLLRKFPFKHGPGGTGHPHGPVLPAQLQLPAWQADRSPVPAQPSGPRRGKAGAGPGAASQRHAAPALPHPHVQQVRPQQRRKLHVYPPRKGRTVLQERAFPFQVDGVRVPAEHHRMGIAHRHQLHRKKAPLQPDLPGRGHLRPAHVHRHPDHLFPPDLQTQFSGACVRVDGQALLSGQLFVVDVFPHTANAVAAHHSAGTVGVEHVHGKIPLPAGAYADQAVSPYAEMPVGQPHGQGG